MQLFNAGYSLNVCCIRGNIRNIRNPNQRWAVPGNSRFRNRDNFFVPTFSVPVPVNSRLVYSRRFHLAKNREILGSRQLNIGLKMFWTIQQWTTRLTKTDTCRGAARNFQTGGGGFPNFDIFGPQGDPYCSKKCVFQALAPPEEKCTLSGVFRKKPFQVLRTTFSWCFQPFDKTHHLSET